MKTTRLMVFCSLFLACMVAFPAFASDPQGERRDPFTPLVGITHGDFAPTIPAAANPLAAYTLGELRVVGIVLGGLGNHAMLLAPDSNTYMIRVGTVIGKFNGIVTEISANVVTIKEVKEYPQDREIVRKEEDVELKLNPLAPNAVAQPRFIVLNNQ